MMATPPPRKPRVPVHGVLLLDKPAGFSSNDALVRAKRMLNALKAGHTGTLDPFATGLLPLCFGEATKFSQDLLEADKTYETVVHLGVRTDTGDTEGEILETRPVDVAPDRIEAVLSRFRGNIAQVPPMYSALKRDGKPLYAYARAGVTLEREARNVTIHALEMLEFHVPYLRLRVRCSKGTYIRVLGEEIGAALDCGGHLQQLRRTEVGGLTLEHAVTMAALESIADMEQRLALLAPVDALLSSFPAVRLSPELRRRFLQGQRLALGNGYPGTAGVAGRVRVYAEDTGDLLGTAMLTEYALLAPERLVAMV
jgi:tRNA pseudouridine55 synthase